MKLTTFSNFLASTLSVLISTALAGPGARVDRAAAATSSSAIDPTSLDASLIGLIDIVATKTGTDPYPTIISAFEAIIPTAIVTGTAQVSVAVSKIHAATPTAPNLFDTAAKYIEAGLSNQKILDLVASIEGPQNGEGSSNNRNTRSPAKTIYPRADAADPKYTVPQAQLRGAIYIPPNFQYGKAGQPVVLVPASSTTGWSAFRNNLIPLLQQSSITDPIWLNIPGHCLDDIQVNAEYIAYAINYISGISGSTKIAAVGLSQGTIATQWVFKYWPSTRNSVADFIGLAGDYHGSIVVNPLKAGVLSPPALIQQAQISNFVAALQTRNGTSAYVPTTNIYSATDEIVEPQSGTSASGRLNDVRGVGVTNNEIQVVCSGAIAGTVYDHDQIVYNPLTYALLIDALQHSGPGRPSRLNLKTVCSTYATPGLTFSNVVGTITDIDISIALNIALYPNKTTQEPPLMSYA